jgi:hypothetical protein
LNELRRRLRRTLAPTRLYYRLNEVRRFIASERQAAPGSVSALVRLRLLARGMTSDKLESYADAGLDRYWSDFDAARTGVLNGVYAELLDRKDMLHHILARLGLGPAIIGVIRRGSVAVQPAPDGGACEQALETVLNQHPNLLLRPLAATDARPPQLLVRQGAYYWLDGLRLDASALPTMFGTEPWLAVTAPLETGSDGAPAAEHFVKLVMLRDLHTAEPFCAYALQPVAPIDPGRTARLPDLLKIAARIDPASGNIGRAATFVRSDNGARRRFFDTHPVSGEAIAGRTVWRWPDAVALANRAMAGLPMIRAASFLLARTSDAYCIVDAANGLDIAAAQLHAPLLDDPRISAIHAAHVVRRPFAWLAGARSAPLPTATGR